MAALNDGECPRVTTDDDMNHHQQNVARGIGTMDGAMDCRQLHAEPEVHGAHEPPPGANDDPAINVIEHAQEHVSERRQAPTAKRTLKMPMHMNK